MTLRANITTTYRENTCPPPTNKDASKEAAETRVHNTEGSHKPLKTATKTPSQRGVPAAESAGSRSTVRNDRQTPADRDSYESSAPDRPTRDEEYSNVKRSGARTLHDREAGSMMPAAPPQYNSAVSGETDRPETRGSSRREGVPNNQTLRQAQPSVEKLAGSDRSKTPLPLPTAAVPRIRQANRGSEPSNKDSASAEAETDQESQLDSGWTATVADETTLQKGLTEALEIHRAVSAEAVTTGAGGNEVVKHLQSEGVFGIAPGGRSLGPIDFIRQKQFEYAMDQKPFTGDDLLLETEKAIYDTLNSDQSATVSRSLLQAVESINAYRNETARAQEYAQLSKGSESAQPTRNSAND